MLRDWRITAADILDFCQKLQTFTGSATRGTLDNHDLVYDGVIRNLELVGEASNRLPEPIRAKCPEIAWRKIIDFRNILIHDYFGINDDILWDVLEVHIPELTKAVAKLLDTET